MTMMAGFDSAALAVFTTVAPAGMLAFSMLGVLILACRDLSDEARARMEHWLVIPLGATWLGFLASATHLGMPSNALYVAAGIGRSPLSNEVAAVVAFLFLSGVYWLQSFRQEDGRRKVSDCLLVLGMVAALVGVGFSGLAYSIGTVPTWDAWYTPVNLWVSGVSGAGALAAWTMMASGIDSPEAKLTRWRSGFLALSGIAVAVGTVVMSLQAGFVAGVANNVTSGAQAVPAFVTALLVHTILCLAGLAIQALAPHAPRIPGMRQTMETAGVAIMFAGLYSARLAFYGIYLPVGF